VVNDEKGFVAQRDFSQAGAGRRDGGFRRVSGEAAGGESDQNLALGGRKLPSPYYLRPYLTRWMDSSRPPPTDRRHHASVLLLVRFHLEPMPHVTASHFTDVLLQPPPISHVWPDATYRYVII